MMTSVNGTQDLQCESVPAVKQREGRAQGSTKNRSSYLIRKWGRGERVPATLNKKYNVMFWIFFSHTPWFFMFKFPLRCTGEVTFSYLNYLCNVASQN